MPSLYVSMYHILYHLIIKLQYNVPDHNRMQYYSMEYHIILIIMAWLRFPMTHEFQNFTRLVLSEFLELGNKERQ